MLIEIMVMVAIILVVLILRSSLIRIAEIQEAGKYQRSIANASERTNQRKVDGLFEVKLAQINSAVNGDGDEFSELLKLISVLPRKDGGEVPPSSTSGVSWDVLKEQLRNPEVRRVIKDNQKEALAILQDG